MTDTINSTPPKLNWSVYVGDANIETFTITDGTNPIDLTGAVVLAQVRTEPTADTASLEAIITEVDMANGKFSVGWDGEQVRALVDASDGDTWRGYWDLQITETGQTLPTTYARGTFSASYDVSRLAQG